MKWIRWIIDQEPALSAGFAAAVAVISAQAAESGWTWSMLWAALPLALSAAVRSVVFSRRTVTDIVAGDKAIPADVTEDVPRFVATTVVDPDAPGEMTYPATGDEPETFQDAIAEPKPEKKPKRSALVLDAAMEEKKTMQRLEAHRLINDPTVPTPTDPGP